jgi:hypothetical protein
VVTAAGDPIVVWDDVFSGSATSGLIAGYARRSEGQWGPSSPASLPFAGRSPRLIAGAGRTIHAFWIDDQGFLRHGAAPADSFGNGGSWGAQVIASSVVDFDAAIGPDGRIHLLCLVADDRQLVAAGVYYIRSGARGDSWSAPVPIHQSDYYRVFLAGPQSGPSAPSADPALPHVEIGISATEETQRVFLAGDNPSLRRIYLAESQDGGATWSAPIEIDGPDPESPYASPHQILAIPDGDDVLLMWQHSEAGGACTQLYQSSSDGGATWGDADVVTRQMAGCLEDVQVLGKTGEATLFFANLQSRAVLLAWDGGRWSLPQIEPELDYFTDPETFGFVEFGCRQAALADGELYVVGCGVSGGGSDVWLTQRPVGDTSSWFEPTSGWAELGHTAISASEILALAASSNEQGDVFALWSEPDTATSSSVSSQFFYAGWDGANVVGPYPVMRRLSGLASQLEVASDGEGRLLVVWTGGDTGELAFSWANDEEVASDSGWVDPQTSAVSGVVGQSPDLLVSGPGSASLAYAVGFNESRGVYLAASEGPTFEWGDPVLVFDAAAAGCDAVEQTSLTEAGDGALHLAWVCSSLPGGIGPLAIYHSRSEDGGATWSEPARILERRAAWSRIAADAEGNLHIVWQEHVTGRVITWDAVSTDGGQEWGDLRAVSVIEGTGSLASLTADRSGRLHLLQAVWEEGSTPLARYSEWDGANWTEGEDLALKVERISDLTGLALAVRGDDSLVAVYVGLGPRNAEGLRVNELRFVTIQLGSGLTPRVEPTPASEAGVAGIQGATPTPTSAPTEAPGSVNAAFAEGSQAPAGGPVGMIAGAVTAIVLVVGIIYVRVRKSNPGKRA